MSETSMNAASYGEGFFLWDGEILQVIIQRQVHGGTRKLLSIIPRHQSHQEFEVAETTGLKEIKIKTKYNARPAVDAGDSNAASQLIFCQCVVVAF